jgi:Putative ABC exporter
VNRALWLLIRLRLTSAFRRLKRNVATVKGALLAAVGLLLFVPWMVSVVFFGRPTAYEPGAVEQVLRFGPLVLLTYCVLNLSFQTGEGVLAFTPAEVNFLFPGPFTRRQLLAYKLTFNFLGILVTAAFMTLFVPLPRATFRAGYVGMVLTLAFIQLFTTAVGLLANAIGVRAYNRWRKAVLAGLGLLAALLLLRLGGDLLQLPPGELGRRVEETPGLQTALEPLRWFLRAYTAPSIWPDLALYAALSLGVDLLLVAFIFALDAQYLEGSLVASERLYAKLQQLRSGGAAAVGLRTSGKPRYSLPMPPWWGGAGPIFWRQLITATRSRGPFVLLFVLVLSMLGPVIATLYLPRAERVSFQMGMFSMVPAMTVALTVLVAFDFRGDLDRMDVLKSLPLGPVPVVVGQLLTPTFVVSLFQWVAVAGLAVAGRHFEAAHVVMMALVVPFNFLLFGLDNLLFLLFPTRIVAASPGDFQALGRNLLVLFVKGITLGGALVLSTLVGLLAYFAGGNSMALGLAAAWFPLAVCAAGIVPLCALAYRRFDVARDTPP